MQYLDQLYAVTKVRCEKRLSILNPPGYTWCLGKQPMWPDKDPNCFSLQKASGSDNFGSNPLYFTFCIKTLLDLSTADNLC